jgi:hypothetical protein
LGLDLACCITLKGISNPRILIRCSLEPDEARLDLQSLTTL